MTNFKSVYTQEYNIVLPNYVGFTFYFSLTSPNVSDESITPKENATVIRPAAHVSQDKDCSAATLPACDPSSQPLVPNEISSVAPLSAHDLSPHPLVTDEISSAATFSACDIFLILSSL